ncbi:hemerythrin HHE cation binding domain-containing protein, partial [Trematosphaeria pertusa]
WEAGPMQLIPTPFSQTGLTDQYTFCASEMALVHNCVVRAFNSIYLQAPHIPVSEYANFVHYCIAAYDGLKAHHEGEEAHFFPEIERITGEKGLMEVNVEQHHAFEKGFNAWGKWLKDIEARKNNFSPDMCRSLMDDFVAPLSTHLNDEIATLLSLARFGDKLDLRAMCKAEADKVMGGLGKTTQLPVFFLNHDTEFEGGVHNFPPIPPPVRWVLREVCGRWNREWWKFSSCGFDGRPR